MSETNTLLDRIDAEFREVEAQIKEYQDAKVQEFQAREARLEQFAGLCESLSEVWRPRLQAFAQRFGDRIQTTPVISRTRRSATLRCASPLAQFDLTLSVMTDADVRHLILDCNLDILPVLMRFDKHSQLELPLDSVDPAVVEQWIDDRLVETVRTYLQLHQNANYLKGHMVSDPVAEIEFPRYAAGATLEWNGKTYYFIGEETRDSFARANGISVESPAEA